MFLILLLMILVGVLSVAASTNPLGYNPYISVAAFILLFSGALSIQFYQKSQARKNLLRTKTLTSARLAIGVGTAVFILSPFILLAVGVLMVVVSSAPFISFLVTALISVVIVASLYYGIAPFLAPYRFDLLSRIFTIPFSSSTSILEQVTPFVKKRDVPFSNIEQIIIGTRDDIKSRCGSAEGPAYQAICVEIENMETVEVDSYKSSGYSSQALPALSWAVSKTDHLLCIKTSDEIFVRSVSAIREEDLIRLGNSAEKEGILVVNYIKERLLA